MSYNELTDLILEYGSDEQKLGMMICETPFSADEYQDLQDHKQFVFDQIYNAILELTK